MAQAFVFSRDDHGRLNLTMHRMSALLMLLLIGTAPLSAAALAHTPLRHGLGQGVQRYPIAPRTESGWTSGTPAQRSGVYLRNGKPRYLCGWALPSRGVARSGKNERECASGRAF